jgi:Carboxypeptidase regulatory-like domain
MKIMRKLVWMSLVLASALLLAPSMAVAQTQSGNLFGTVSDEQGNALPGVTVTLSGGGAPSVQTTDEQGKFRFPGLSPGSYDLSAALDGFSPVEYPNIAINITRNTEVELTMNAAIGETITVTTETALLDPRRIATGNAVTQTELERIPTARDPWAVLQSTPGVLTDRINVGGNESGQQSQYVGPGSAGDQAVWSVDGMIITDMSATGSSPAYYDFDSFEEMQVTTGGSDATMATGGVTMNMVTKRGTNEWRGSGRYLLADDSLQSDLDFDEGDLGATQTAFKQGNRIVEITDYGIELGGPIVEDRAWIWGSYAKPEINLLTVADVSDKTTLETWNLKLNGQVSASNSATFFAIQSDKVKIGRDAGPTRSQETTFNQAKFGPDPTGYKVEDTHVFSSAFYLSGMYSKVNGGFELAPQGGDRFFFRDTGLRWHGSFFHFQIERPQEQFKLDGSGFLTTGSVNHELRFGAGYREAEQSSLSHVSGGAFELHRQNAAGVPLNSSYIIARDGQIDVRTDYTNLYVQDTLSVGNLTANIGLRFDIQQGENLPSSAAAGPVLPGLLPAVSFNGADGGFKWEDVVPRLGLTYALGSERQTLLRASYSRFADQLATGVGGFLHPLGNYAYLFFRAPRGNGVAVPSNILDFPILATSPNYNPETGGFLISNAVDPDFSAPITDELLLGVEHALLPEFVVGLNLTYRKLTNLIELENLVFDGDAFSHDNLNRTGRAHRSSDYVQAGTLTGTLPNGQAYSIPYNDLRDGVTTRGGFLMENGDREQEYKGLSLIVNKRLANRWMMRGNISFSDWKWNIPGSENEDPLDTVGGGVVDGTDVLQGSGTVSGAKGNVFINSNWSYSLNAMYQVVPDRPWGFNVAANLTGRQGYPIRYVNRLNGQRAADNFGVFDVPIKSDPDAFRNDDVHVLDLRLEKEFTFNDFGLTLGADCFNALNSATVLQRQGILVSGGANVGTGDHVQEILSPRVFRLGARISFR